MSRHKRGIKAAVEAARRSDFHSHKVGAAIFLGSRLISIGYNKRKSHPRNAECWSRHAEVDSLIKFLNSYLPRAILYVARLTRTGKISCAKPCKTCQEFISKLKIKKVFYTNYAGIIEKLT